MLNPSPMERSLKPRPMMPSKGISWKGSADSRSAAMKFASMQMESPMHNLSRKKSPATWPVPKVISEEPSPRSFTMADMVLDAFREYLRWGLQPALPQSALGTIRLPLPVSKMTLNCCGGLPRDMEPQ